LTARALRRSLAAAGGLLLAVAAQPVAAFDAQGHRGVRGLMPENTLPAFATALSIGVTTLEFDVGITRDGAVVIAHDRRLNPDIARRDGVYVEAPGPAIHTLTLAELRNYDVGTLRPGSRYAAQWPQQKQLSGVRIPTVGELAALVRRANNAQVRFNVETKISPLAPDETVDPEVFASTLVKALRREGIAARSTVQSFDWRTLRAVQRLAPEIATVCLTIERGENDNVQRGKDGASPWLAGLDVDDYAGSVPHAVDAAGCRIWSPFHRDLTPDALATAKALGLAVVTWTVNEPAEMRRLIDNGVDGIITDYPDRLRAVMAEQNMPLPPATPVEP